MKSGVKSGAKNGAKNGVKSGVKSGVKNGLKSGVKRAKNSKKKILILLKAIWFLTTLELENAKRIFPPHEKAKKSYFKLKSYWLIIHIGLHINL